MGNFESLEGIYCEFILDMAMIHYSLCDAKFDR